MHNVGDSQNLDSFFTSFETFNLNHKLNILFGSAYPNKYKHFYKIHNNE